MGIQGLLPLLKPIHRPVNIAEFSGQAVGVDAYCWLHKGAYGCAMDIVEGKQTSVYINYVLRRINMMLFHKIKPILVFDGSYLPSKAGKEAERRKSRNNNKAKGLAFLRAGNRAQAQECFQKCIDISPEMALNVIKACRKKGVDCIVAPYEADAQLAYLIKSNIAQAIISEDSDLLVYGCKRVIFKMDSMGNGTLVDLNNLGKLTELRMHEFSEEKFRHMCILSGCDYLPSIKGIGLMKANKMLRKSSNVKKLVRSIRLDDQMKVPPDYEENFQRAEETFLYQLVFDPVSQTLVHLNPLPEGLETKHLNFAGPMMSQKKAIGIALGNINPITGETIADFDPNTTKILTANTNDEAEEPAPSTCAFAFSAGKQDLTPLSTTWEKSAFRHGRGVQRNLDLVPALPSMKRPCKDDAEGGDDEQAFLDMYTKVKSCSLEQKDCTQRQSRPQPLPNKSNKPRPRNPFRNNNKESDQGTEKLSRYFSSSGTSKIDSNQACKEENSEDEEMDTESLMEGRGRPGALLSTLANDMMGGHNRTENKENCSLLFVDAVNNSTMLSQSMNNPDDPRNEPSSSGSSPNNKIGLCLSKDDSEESGRNPRSILTDHNQVKKKNKDESFDKARDTLKRFLYQSGSQRSLNHYRSKDNVRNLSESEKSALDTERSSAAQNQIEVIDIDSGYLSDGEETGSQSSQGAMDLLPGSQTQRTLGRFLQSGSSAGLKTMKNQIQVKSKSSGSRLSGLGRCRAMGISKRKTSSKKPVSKPESPAMSLLKHFEYNKNKRARLGDEQLP